MHITTDSTVRKLAEVLRAAQVPVPDIITPESAHKIMMNAKGSPGTQHAAVHLYIHVELAQQCADTATQMGQADPASEQAAQ